MHIVVNEDNVLEICYLQTNHMKQLYDIFPEIMFIDGTYSVNGHGMPLYCIMVKMGMGMEEWYIMLPLLKKTRYALEK